jgi:hypothetical protein
VLALPKELLRSMERPYHYDVALGNWDVLSNSKVTIAFWVQPFSVPGGLAQRGDVFLLGRADSSTYEWTIRLTNDPALGGITNATYPVQVLFQTSASPALEYFSATSIPVGSTWTHVAIGIDITDPSNAFIQFYFNGVGSTPIQLEPADVDIISENRPIVIGVDPTNNFYPFYGRLGEVYIYDELLDSSAIVALYQNTAPATPQAPTITTPPVYTSPSSYNTTVLAGFTLTGVAQPGDASLPLQYFWTDFSNVGCDVASIKNSSAQTVDLTLSAISSLQLDLNVMDQYCSVTSRTLVFVSGNLPTFTVPLSSNYSVYLNENLTITVEETGFPTPVVSWQQAVVVNATNKNGNYVQLSTWRTLATGSSIIVSNGNSSAGHIVSARQVSNSDTFVQNITCLLTNSLGTIRSDPIIITGLNYTRPIPPSNSASSGSSSTGLIVGLTVGLVLGGLLIAGLVASVAVFAIIWKVRGRVNQIKVAKPDYESLAYGNLSEDHVNLSKSQQSNLRKLEDLLLEEDFALTQTICETMKATDAEQVAKALAYIYAGHGQAVELLKFFITKEVGASNKEGTLFRANSVSTKIFNCYARMIGIHYVWTIFALPVTELNVMAIRAEGREDDDGDTTHTTTLLGPVIMEVDPSKMEEAADEQVNTLQLWLIAQKLFVALTRSHGALPKEIKQVLKHVNREVEEKFNEQAAHKAVGGFLFLRFLCPALMAPQVYGLLKDPPHSTTQRQLILVAKVMQNLANDTLPGKKEGYMERLNDFITSNQQPLRQFYATLINNADEGSSADLDVPSIVTLNSLIHLHKHISTNLDKIMADLQQDHEDVAEQLKEIMDNVGTIDVDFA